MQFGLRLLRAIFHLMLLRREWEFNRYVERELQLKESGLVAAEVRLIQRNKGSLREN